MADRHSNLSPLYPSDSVSRYYTRHSQLISTTQANRDDNDREEDYEMLYEPPYEFNYWCVISALDKISINENVTTIDKQQSISSTRPAPLPQTTTKTVTTTTTASSSLLLPEPSTTTCLLHPTFQRDRSLSSTSTATISSISSHTTNQHNQSIDSIFESPTLQSFLSPLARITSLAMSSMILDLPPTPPTLAKERKSQRG